MSDNQLDEEEPEKYASDYWRKRLYQPETVRNNGFVIHHRESLARTWAVGLSIITLVLMVVVYVSLGDMFAVEQRYGSDEFNALAGFIGAIATAVPMLPWIALFHVVSKKPA